MNNNHFIFLLNVAFLCGCTNSIDTAKDETKFAANCSIENHIEASNSAIEVDNLTIADKYESNSSEFQEIANTLFEDFILKNITPRIILNSEDVYELDLETYQQRLSQFAIFMDEFYKNEVLRYKSCANELKRLKIKEADVKDEPYWEPSDCYADHCYWLKAQDDPGFCEIENLQIIKNLAEFDLQFYDNFDQKTYWHVNLKIKLKKINGEWLITKIERIDRPI